MNIALFGAGAIAHDHARAIRVLQATPPNQQLCLYGVATPQLGAAEAFAAEYRIPHVATSPARFVDDPAVDAVIICSPSAMHPAQTAAALSAGKHVLCEIPLALSLTVAADLCELAVARNRTLMVAHTLRFSPSLLALHHRITQNLLTPTAIVSRLLFMRRTNIGWTGRRRSWTDNLLWHHGCHAVDTCLWLLGAEAADVTGVAAPADPELGVPLDVGIGLRTPCGAVATIALSYNSHVKVHDYVVVGRETTFLASPEHLTDAAGQAMPPLTSGPLASALVVQDAEFFAAIREARAAAVSAAAALPTLAVLQAVADAAGLTPTAEETAAAEAALLDTWERV